MIGLGLVLLLAATVTISDDAARGREAFRHGDPATAVLHLDAALASPDAADDGALWFDLGVACFARRDLTRARAALERSVEVFDDKDRRLEASLAREGLARVQIEQADWIGAAETLDRAASGLDSLPSVHPHRARRQALIAVVQQALGRLDLAEAAHETALRDYRALLGNQHVQVAAMLQNLATLTAAREDSLLTENLLDQALDIVERNRGADDPHRARPLLTHANWAFARGDVERAARSYAEADSLVVRALGRDHADRIELLRGRARCAVTQGDVVSAVGWLEQAAAIYEMVWVDGGRDLARATAFSSPFADLAIVHATAGRFDAAWDAWESHVGRLAEHEARTSTVSPDRVGALLPPASALVGWIESVVAPGATRRWVFRLDRTGVVWHDLGLVGDDAPELEFRTQVADVTGPAPASALARRIHARWFGALDLDDLEHLYLVPAGALLGIPVAALVDGSDHALVDRFTTTIVPSATALVGMLERPRDRRVESLLAVADPVFGGGDEIPAGVEPDLVLRSAAAGNPDALARLTPLHATREEVEALLPGFVETTVLVGDDAREAELRAALGDRPDVDVVHLATHALVDPMAPERSALILTGAGTPDASPDDDGRVLLREVLDEMSLDSALVVLSACDTGLGRSTATEGLLGFPFAFLHAGAHSVLVSQWKVEDRATAAFMTAFYRAWLRDDPTAPLAKARALREAQVTLRDWRNPAGRRPWSRAAHWAAFVMVGD